MKTTEFQHPTYTYKATIVNVVDGDTFDAHIDVGFNTYLFKRLRLLDIDTWELRLDEYDQGVLAKERAEQLLAESDYQVFIQTEMDGEGKYGRVLARVWTKTDLGGAHKNIASVLLNEGHGTPL